MTAAFIALLDREISGSIGNKGDTLNYILKQIANGNQAPYKVYTALLTQSGTDAPTAVVLQNTIGDITYLYDDVGSYLISSDELFTDGKTQMFFGALSIQNHNWGIIMEGNKGINYLGFQTLNESGALANDYLYNTSIEIRVYE